MNDVAVGILESMENSSMGRMSIFVLKKQSADMGIDLDNVTVDQAAMLTERLKDVLPFFLADETDEVIMNIRKHVNNRNMVIG